MSKTSQQNTNSTKSFIASNASVAVLKCAKMPCFTYTVSRVDQWRCLQYTHKTNQKVVIAKQTLCQLWPSCLTFPPVLVLPIPTRQAALFYQTTATIWGGWHLICFLRDRWSYLFDLLLRVQRNTAYSLMSLIDRGKNVPTATFALLEPRLWIVAVSARIRGCFSVAIIIQHIITFSSLILFYS